LSPDLEEKKLLEYLKEVMAERRFWFTRSINYANLYITLVSGLLSAYFITIVNLPHLDIFRSGLLQLVLLALPLSSFLFCRRAKEILHICYQRFLENTCIMEKIEYDLGFYSPRRKSEDKTHNDALFPNDPYINIARHLEYLKQFNNSDEFIKKELSEKHGTFGIMIGLFSLLELISAVIIVISSLISFLSLWWQQSQYIIISIVCIIFLIILKKKGKLPSEPMKYAFRLRIILFILSLLFYFEIKLFASLW